MQAFQLTRPGKIKRPVVASIPHCGVYVPDEIQILLKENSKNLAMTDWFLHKLYDFLPELGVTIIAANYSRYVIDLNRSPVPLELYPGRFETKLVSDKDFQGNDIFKQYPSSEQIDFFQQNVHAVYHSALLQELENKQQKFGKVYLFDLHSIAKDATLIHAELQKDIYLGDRDGLSCSPQWSQSIAEQFTANDFSIQINSPYKGGYITHHYGQEDKVEAIQIEMNQDVYMQSQHVGDLSSAMTSAKFKKAKTRLRALFTALLENMEC